MTKKKKIITIISILLALMILVYHIIWYITFKSYDKYTQANMFIREEYYYSTYTDYESDQTFSVYSLRYPYLSGYLSISPDHMYNRPVGDTSVELSIHPKLFGRFEISVIISTVTEAHYIESVDLWEVESANTILIHLDENMQPIDNPDEESLRAYEDNIEQIKLSYKMAYDMWGILKVE